MKLSEFWDGIKLGSNHREAVLGIDFDLQECDRLYELYQKNHNEFFNEVLKKEKNSLWFLWLYSNMACEVYSHYKEEGISEEIFWNTFQDIRFWCENTEREFGIMGLAVYEWFYRHIDMVLFRFGRLQFEKMKMQCSVSGKADETGKECFRSEKEKCEKYNPVENVKIEKGTEVINIHIPQGEALNWEACESSIKQAKEFLGDDKLYVCHSWLLYLGLDEVLSERSNIREFRKHFRVLEVDYKEREAEWRVFGKVLKNVAEYPEETSLQKKVKTYLLEGKCLGNGWAVLE